MDVRESNCTVAIRAVCLVEGWYRLPICQGDRLKQFANCATYSNCLCATVLILCKPTNDSQVSRVAATECGKCDKVRRSTGTSATLDRNHPPTPWHNPLLMSPLVAYYRALRQLSVEFKGLPPRLAATMTKERK